MEPTNFAPHGGPPTSAPPAPGGIEDANAPDAAQATRHPSYTELCDRVAELEEAVRARDDLLATVAHELRNPVSPMYLQVQHLADAVDQGQDPVSVQWLTPRLQSLSRRMRRYMAALDRLLDASRVASGRMSIEPSPTDLVMVVRDVVASCEREGELAGCVITLDAPPSLWGNWDPLRIEQIVRNLLSNAIRYGSGHPIHVGLGRVGEQVCLEIEDQGVGISEPDQQRIFERFERVQEGHRSGSFGIGLWLVRRLSEALGGSVHVRSQLGRGSTFTVCLPGERTQTS